MASESLNMREEEPKKKGLSERARKEIREWIICLAVALILFVLVRTFLFTVVRIQQNSMRETLHEGDRVIATIIDMKLYGVQRGDVVICRYPNRKEQFVKRIVGLPGDEIAIKDGVTYVNGEAQDEPYVTHIAKKDFGPYAVPEGRYFVMGDNRANSHDSRDSDVGPLEEDMLVGIARLIMWPFSHAGTVSA